MNAPPPKQSLKSLARKFPDADPDAIELTIRLLICTSRLEEIMTMHFQGYGLSQARFSILMHLYRSPEHKAKPIEIAEFLGVTRGNMTSILENLKRDGLIVRKNCPTDRRINFVCLTAKGTKHLTKMLPEHFQRIRQLVKPLSKSERETFMVCLEKLQKSMLQFKTD